MKTGIFVAATVAMLASTPVMAAETRSCADVTKKEIAALFKRWESSLRTRDAEKVAENYAPDAVLIPTVSNKVRTDHEGIKDYFEHFLQKKPKGKINSSNISIGCNEAFDAGTYTFTLTGEDGKKSDVPARYTFIYELREGKWLITHHHSSGMPEKAEEAAH